jgi:pimeloyl-ACP methyl ester carboxylesterase
MQLATRDGVKLHVQELGAGPPVVMLHGLLVGNMATWYWTSAAALAHHHHVVLFDLRGHGLSERAPRGYDVESMVNDLEDVIAATVPANESVTLVGHSYGAVIALTYALRHPERMEKIAVVEAPLPPSRLEELERFLRESPENMLDSLPPELREVVLKAGRRARRFVEAATFLVTESSLVDDLRRARDVSDEALASLRCVLLAIYGTTSSCRPIGARLARVVPRAQLVELEGGHFLPAESPAAVTEALTRFIDG